LIAEIIEVKTRTPFGLPYLFIQTKAELKNKKLSQNLEGITTRLLQRLTASLRYWATLNPLLLAGCLAIFVELFIRQFEPK
jgi:hypothetical protein